MEQYKQDFITFMVESDVLKFGEFTLKSGRTSPFFMNAGAYVTGEQLKRLGESYARAIHDNFGLDFDIVFGPAYKGIPLSVVTAIALFELYARRCATAPTARRSRTTARTRATCSAPSSHDGDRVVMVEDVTTSGKSSTRRTPS